MERPFNERFKLLLKHYDLRSIEASRRIGVDRQVTDSYLKTAEPRLEMLVQILKAFPEVNIHWLILGRGNMLSDHNENMILTHLEKTGLSEQQMIKKFWEEDRKELEKLRELTIKLTEKLLKTN